MYNALSADKTRDDLKEVKREIRTISEKLKSQVTSGEEGMDLIYIRKCNKVIMLLEGRQNEVITRIYFFLKHLSGPES